MKNLTDRQTYDLQSSLYSLAFYWFQFRLGPESAHWSHLAHLMLGVAQWQAKGNQNQMGPDCGPTDEAAIGPSWGWLVSRACQRRKGCKSDDIGVVHHTIHCRADSRIVAWQRDNRRTGVL